MLGNRELRFVPHPMRIRTWVLCSYMAERLINLILLSSSGRFGFSLIWLTVDEGLGGPKDVRDIPC